VVAIDGAGADVPKIRFIHVAILFLELWFHDSKMSDDEADVSLTPEHINVLARIKKNQVLMFQDRGYILPPSEQAWLALDHAQAVVRIRDAEDPKAILDAFYDEPKVWVYYATFLGKFGTEEAATIIEQIEEQRLFRHRLFLVTHVRPTAGAWEALPSDLEAWTYAQLAVNPTRHFLAQRHTPLSTEEKREFLATTKIDPQCLPMIYVSDPVARWYGFRVGQILRVDRTNLVTFAAGASVFYRLVVPEPLSDHATKPVVGLP